MEKEITMKTKAPKISKHFRLNTKLLEQARKILKTKSETETIEKALEGVVYQEKMRELIERSAGKYEFRGL